MGTRPSSRPTRATPGHSRPLARWKVDSSTASPSGSASARAPSPAVAASQARNPPMFDPGSSTACSSASRDSAGRKARARDSAGARRPVVGNRQVGQGAAERPSGRHGPSGLHGAGQGGAGPRRRSQPEGDPGLPESGGHRAETGVRPGQDGQVGPGPTGTVHQPQPPGHRARFVDVVIETDHRRGRTVGSAADGRAGEGAVVEPVGPTLVPAPPGDGQDGGGGGDDLGGGPVVGVEPENRRPRNEWAAGRGAWGRRRSSRRRPDGDRRPRRGRSGPLTRR